MNFALYYKNKKAHMRYVKHNTTKQNQKKKGTMVNLQLYLDLTKTNSEFREMVLPLKFRSQLSK